MSYKDPSLMGLWVLTHLKKANEIIYIKIIYIKIYVPKSRAGVSMRRFS